MAGIAVMVSTLPGLPPGLRACAAEEGLPELPETRVLLLKARNPRQPVTDFMEAQLMDKFDARAPCERATPQA